MFAAVEVEAEKLVARGHYSAALKILRSARAEGLAEDEAIAADLLRILALCFAGRAAAALPVAEDLVQRTRNLQDAGRGRVLILYAMVLGNVQRYRDAGRALEAGIRLVGDDGVHLSIAARVRGRIKVTQGDATWETDLLDAVRHARRGSSRLHEAVALLDLSRGLFFHRRPAEETLADTEALFDALGNAMGLGYCAVERANHAARAGDRVAAGAHLDRAEMLGQGEQSEALVGMVAMTRARSLWRLGDYAAALRIYREYAQGSGTIAVQAQLALGSSHLALGDYEQARDTLETLSGSLFQVTTLFSGFVSALLAEATGRLGDWAAFDDYLELARVGLKGALRSDPSVAASLQRTLDLLGENLDAVEGAELVSCRFVRVAALVFESPDAATRNRVRERLREAAPRLSDLPLGGFAISEPLGAGGVGTVWRGRRLQDGLPVAIKVIDGGGALWRREVLAVAALDHPNIAGLVDLGEVSSIVSEASAGRLTNGANWLAFELVEGGSLERHCGRVSWEQGQGLLFVLLDAIAQAHAHDFLHLDLKPSNVLIDDPSKPETLRLTDFGIAFRVDEVVGKQFVAGTPAFMAPEQFLGDWRSFGPWTDLYAFGWLAFTLLTGRHPFGEGLDYREYARAHLAGERPELPAAWSPELRSWIRRLTERDPRERFRSAADARNALVRIAVTQWSTPHTQAAAFLPDTLTHLPTGPTLVGPLLLELELKEAGSPSRALTQESVPPPSTWGTPYRRLMHVSADLLEQRVPRMTGRIEERDALWAALLDVYWSREPRAVVLRGAPGIGKRRLGRWLGEVAVTSGAASRFVVPHEPNGDGFVSAIIRNLRLQDLEGEALTTRIRKNAQLVYQQEETIEAIRALVEREQPPGSPEQLAVIAHLLRRYAADRPVLLLAEGVQYAPRAIGMIAELLSCPDAPAVLFVLSHSADEQTPETASRLQRFAQHPRVSEMLLPPLGAEDIGVLLDSTAPLDAAVREDLIRGAAGSPRAARLMLDYLFRERALERVRGAYAYRFGWRDRVPHSPVEIWRRRLDALANGELADARFVLQVAATFGPAIRPDILERALEFLEVTDGDVVVEYLLDASFLTNRQGLYVFGDEPLRAWLKRSMEDVGMSARIHLACAEAYGDDPAHPRRLLQRAKHLCKAGAAVAALDCLDRLPQDWLARRDDLLALAESIRVRCDP